MATAKTYTGPKRGFVLSPHGNIEYGEMGDGPPLILLHSTPNSSGQLRPMLPLIKDHVRGIAMSTMGFGESDTPPYPYTTLHEYAQCVIWLMDGLGLDKVNLFGTHTGSNIAVEVAVSWPDRVDKLILEECFNWCTPSRRAVHERLHKYYPEKHDGSHLISLWATAGGSRPGADKNRLRQSFMDRFRINHMDNGGAEVYGPMGWEGSAPYAMCRYEMWEATPRIKAPTLVTHGTNSDLVKAHEKFLETIPRSKGHKFQSRGIFLPYESPEEWARVLIDFLRDPGI